ncbi:MAG: proteobacterial dedicated sortase system response regulator [Cellvibrionales bacterium]|nr:proteobacterial dedicated sortase system response regulator [Cellvibrionales bacterium]
MRTRIALVEDDTALASNYKDLLSQAGYHVDWSRNAEDARASFAANTPDLALLDIGLGNDSEAGFELCRELRSTNPLLPIIFLSARDDEIDIISGLRLGADDYLTKDISNAQLLARINAMMRRIVALKSPENQEQVLRRGDLELNVERFSTKWKDTTIALTFTEFWMLHSLAKHPGHIRNRQQLMDAANVVLDDSTITSHVRRIRRKFEEADGEFDRIETAYGLGYRWLPEN